MSIDIEDYRWLVSGPAARLLADTKERIDAGTNIVRIAKSLRKEVSVVRSALVLELVQLRIRARKKFRNAEQMFFTKRGLEQSTGYLIGDYKATRFAEHQRVADICCSIGGDLMSLARRTRTTGMDRDPLASLFAQKNLEVNQLNDSSVANISFEQIKLNDFDGIHVDPDRRAHGVQSRTTRGDFFSPTLAQIIARVDPGQAVGIKVAPATRWSPSMPGHHEREWIGNRRECKQQVIWLGTCVRSPGRLTATRVITGGRWCQFHAEKQLLESAAPVAPVIRKYIYEPHSTILAGSMTDAIANQYALQRLGHDIVYLTGDDRVSDRMLRRFKIRDVVSLSLQKVALRLSELKVGNLDIKHRGIPLFTVEKFHRIRTRGDEPAVLILTRHHGRQIAIIARK
jgi:hypothetical protein